MQPITDAQRAYLHIAQVAMERVRREHTQYGWDAKDVTNFNIRGNEILDIEEKLEKWLKE